MIMLFSSHVRKAAGPLFLALALFTSACGTMRLNYEGEVRAADAKPASYNLKKSYEVGGPHKMLCILTGVFFGGYCWYYTVMPTTEQSRRIEQDAQARLDKIYGSGKYSLTRTKVEVDGWSEMEEQSNLVRSEDAPTPLVNGRPLETKKQSAKKEVEEPAADDSKKDQPKD